MAVPASASPAELLSSLSDAERANVLADLTEEEAAALEYDWRFWARPAQVAPAGAWHIWLIMAGRGFGKTRAGAEWIREGVEHGACARVALIGETAADARDVMVEGESGILAISPPWNRPRYEPSKRRLTWPNGAVATTYSADDPEQLRGPQHDRAWADEPGKWRYADETWSNLMLGLRLGTAPQAVATTTPRRTKLIRELVERAKRPGSGVVLTHGSTYDNIGNLAPTFINEIVLKYEGTRLGRQELLAQLLDDVPGALWTVDLFDRLRVPAPPELVRVEVAIDPAVTSGEHADDTGILIGGIGIDGHGYVLSDQTCHLSPEGWARRAINAYRHFAANRIIGEVNNGGDLVETTIRLIDPTVPFTAVHASRGKRVRAEPISLLYERGLIHHVGTFPDLEDQLCQFVPDQLDDSPDRLDALVWLFTSLFVEGRTAQTGPALIGTHARTARSLPTPRHPARRTAGRR